MVFLTLLWVIIIFLFSIQPGETSSQLSSGIGKWLMETFLPGLFENMESISKEQLQLWHFLLRKYGHFTEFMILGILSALTVQEAKRKRGVLEGFLFCVLVASIDETIQLFVPGRSGQISDMLLDCTGALAGILLMFIIRRFKERHFQKCRILPNNVEKVKSKDKTSVF